MIRSTTLDKFAIFLSGVCILHCLVTPLIVTLLPIITVSGFVEDLLFHKLMLWLVLPTSCIALFIGCRKHRDLLIAGTGIIGMLILIVVTFFGHDVFGEAGERIASSVGGLILAFSHFLNFRACQETTCEDSNCAMEHHH
ncbi:MAG: MerC domain-containing protein [Acidiferrobacterales bacterium]|nr:MerC domain-containing protein [Acidiferrobacterales bacterium]